MGKCTGFALEACIIACGIAYWVNNYFSDLTQLGIDVDGWLVIIVIASMGIIALGSIKFLWACILRWALFAFCLLACPIIHGYNCVTYSFGERAEADDFVLPFRSRVKYLIKQSVPGKWDVVIRKSDDGRGNVQRFLEKKRKRQPEPL